MRILVEIGHPAHVHFFRNPISLWRAKGHDVQVVSRDKDVTLHLLNAYKIPSFCLSKAGRGVVGLLREMLIRDWRLWKLARRFKPHILTSIGGTWISQVSKLIGKPALVFYDTENARLSNAATYPLVAALCTPKCYTQKTGLGDRHVRYPGYHELAYLHPRRFEPDRKILSLYGLSADADYFIVRFVGWGAGHDLGERGLSLEKKEQLIRMLARHGRVLITSEAGLRPPLQRYASPVLPEQMHHLVAFAKMVVGESATMASESAMLGVPAIYIADTTRGYVVEQERQYGLVHHFPNDRIDEAMDQIESFLGQDDLMARWQEKREKMLRDTVDVTAFVEEIVTGYPESLSYFRKRWSALQQEA